MKIRDITWRRYRIPFVVPFRTAHGQRTHRDGVILRISTDDGSSGLGDAAPLPEFGGGNLDLTDRQLRKLAPELIGLDTAEIDRLLGSRLAGHSDVAALRCALDSALLDLTAKNRGARLADLLGPSVVENVPVNATIGQSDTELAVRAARDAIARGFQTIKLKVGVSDSVTGEVQRIATVRDAIGPHVALRLDANGAWEPDLAIRILNMLGQLDIELVEQPVAAHDLAGLGAVRRAVGIPIAADEAVTDLESARRAIELESADILVVKPMVCGGLRAARQIIDLASQAGLRVIVTSSLESGVGIAAALHLAATLPEDVPACGLATAGLLADDLIADPLPVTTGRMQLPDGSGLGVTLDEEHLSAYAADDWQRVS